MANQTTAHDVGERTGRGLLSRFLGAVFLVVLGGLLLLDRALLRVNTNQANIDARTAGFIIESFIENQATILEGIAGTASVQRARLDTAIIRVMGNRTLSHAPSWKAAWIADGTGRVFVNWTRAGSTSDPDIAGQWQRQINASYPRPRRVTIISSSRFGERGTLVLLQPLDSADTHGGGYAALLFDIDLRSRLVEATSETRRSLALLSGTDTIAFLGNTHAGREDVAAGYGLVRLPTGGTWRVETTHVRETRSLRLTLWLMGVLGVSFLGLGLLREQKRSQQAASRSAELERLYSDVKRANQAKSEFLANVSHELRTPLNAIVGFVELLHDGYYGDLSPRQALPVDRISASATHLRHLVDQVLDIAKIAAGRLEIHPESIVLRAFAINVASELESLIGEKNLSFAITISASLPRVRTDPTHLRQILINLIGNAVKYTPAGTISVRARYVESGSGNDVRDVKGVYGADSNQSVPSGGAPGDGHWIALQVADTGVGIAAKDRERIFDEFEQVNAGPRGDSMQRGTGLGLAISRRLARLLGGEITLESELGEGSTFTVWLSVSPADLSLGAASPDSVSPGPGGDATS